MTKKLFKYQKRIVHRALLFFLVIPGDISLLSLILGCMNNLTLHLLPVLYSKELHDKKSFFQSFTETLYFLCVKEKIVDLFSTERFHRSSIKQIQHRGPGVFAIMICPSCVVVIIIAVIGVIIIGVGICVQLF